MSTEDELEQELIDVEDEKCYLRDELSSAKQIVVELRELLDNLELKINRLLKQLDE